MTQEIEGTQGQNDDLMKADAENHQPMRPDDTAGAKGGEPVVEGDKEADAQTDTVVQQAQDAVTVTDTFLVHDNDSDPRRAKNPPPTPDPHELLYIGIQEHVRNMVAFHTQDSAARWVGGYANRRIWPVRSITLGQPLLGVIIPERLQLMTEEEAKETGRMEADR